MFSAKFSSSDPEDSQGARTCCGQMGNVRGTNEIHRLRAQIDTYMKQRGGETEKTSWSNHHPHYHHPPPTHTPTHTPSHPYTHTPSYTYIPCNQCILTNRKSTHTQRSSLFSMSAVVQSCKSPRVDNTETDVSKQNMIPMKRNDVSVVAVMCLTGTVVIPA